MEEEAPQSRLRPRTAVAGRRTQSKEDTTAAAETTMSPVVPRDIPDIVELKKSLPAHVFKPSVLRSLSYVARDWAVVGALYLAALWAEQQLPAAVVRGLVYPTYWFFQGTMFWAIFVLGHDCGHGSFSSSSLLNDIMGNLLHAPILVPYYPWKVSHRHHHKNTGNMDKDEIFYPVREKYAPACLNRGEGLEKSNGQRFIPLFGLGVSWFYYLARGYKPRPSNHLNPLDPLFARHALQCFLSLSACAAWIMLAVIPYYTAFGAAALAAHYAAPIFVFASWLVVTTFLHHQDEGVPWYGDSSWDFVRGNLSSVDRDYGWAHGLVHNIGTHQIHHLFTRIPHYHLEEATAAFRAKYPHLVRKSSEAILPAFCRLFWVFERQPWVKDDADVHIFGDKQHHSNGAAS